MKKQELSVFYDYLSDIYSLLLELSMLGWQPYSQKHIDKCLPKVKKLRRAVVKEIDRLTKNL